MGLKAFLLALFVALGFGGWPIAANYSRAGSAWISMAILGVGTVVVAIPSLLSGQLSKVSAPNPTGMLWLLGAAILNGIVMIIYSTKLADHTTPAGPLVVTVSVLMVVWAVLLDWMLNGVAPTFRQAIGFTLAATAIYFLKQ